MIGIISNWREEGREIVYRDEAKGFSVIRGMYAYDDNDEPRRALGLHWDGFPLAPRNTKFLAPMDIPDFVREAILIGLFFKSLNEGDKETVKSVREAFDFFSDDDGIKLVLGVLSLLSEK